MIDIFNLKGEKRIGATKRYAIKHNGITYLSRNFIYSNKFKGINAPHKDNAFKIIRVKVISPQFGTFAKSHATVRAQLRNVPFFIQRDDKSFIRAMPIIAEQKTQELSDLLSTLQSKKDELQRGADLYISGYNKNTGAAIRRRTKGLQIIKSARSDVQLLYSATLQSLYSLLRERAMQAKAIPPQFVEIGDKVIERKDFVEATQNVYNDSIVVADIWPLFLIADRIAKQCNAVIEQLKEKAAEIIKPLEQ